MADTAGIQLRGKVYYSDFFIGDKTNPKNRVRQSLRTNNEAEARKRSQALFDKLSAAATDEDGNAKDGVLAVGEVLDFAYEHKWKHMKDRKKKGLVELVRELVGASTPVAKINRKYLGDLQAKLLKEKKLSKATTNRYIDCLSGAINIYNREHEIEARLNKPERFREPKSRFRYLEDAEIARLVAAEDDFRYRVYWKSQLWIGARASEGRGMQWKYFDWKDGLYFVGNDKVGNPQMIPVRKDLLEDFKVLFEAGHPRPFQYTEGQVRHRFDRLKERAGIKDPSVTIHTMRRTCATKLLEDGLDIRTVQVWLGHKNVSTTERYAIVKPKTLIAYRDRVDAAEMA